MEDPPKHLAVGVTLAIGGVLVTLILFLLPPKTPGSVAFCLLPLFFLPLYPIWIWCRTRKHTWPRLPGILIVWVILAWFGRSAWQEGSTYPPIWLVQERLNFHDIL